MKLPQVFFQFSSLVHYQDPHILAEKEKIVHKVFTTVLTHKIVHKVFTTELTHKIAHKVFTTVLTQQNSV